MAGGKAFIHRSSKDNDFPTPESMTRQLLEVEKFDFRKEVREPACGDGFMSEVLRERFSTVYATDIKYGVDFYKADMGKIPYIITNPPFGKDADKFVKRSKQLYTRKIALLLRTNYLSGQERYMAGIYQELSRVYVFTRMPDLTAAMRVDGKYPTAGIVYAWFIWEKGYRGLPRILHIDNQKYVLKKSDK